MATRPRIVYTDSTGSAEVSLDGPLAYVGAGLGIRGRSWAYTLGRRGISGQHRAAREASLTADFLDLAEADRARGVFDRDVAAGAPGTLSCGGWSQRAYVVRSEPSDRFGSWVRADITVLLLDGVWRKRVDASFTPEGAGTHGKAYAYGYPYDYAPPGNTGVVSVDAPAACPLRLVIYGYAKNPSVTIGGNAYTFDAEVPTGGYLLVDTRPDPSVTLVDSAGRSLDAFSAARRGRGLGSGEYAFQPLSPGTQTVSWDRTFGFDLGVYLEEGEIPWTS